MTAKVSVLFTRDAASKTGPALFVCLFFSEPACQPALDYALLPAAVRKMSPRSSSWGGTKTGLERAVEIEPSFGSVPERSHVNRSQSQHQPFILVFMRIQVGFLDQSTILILFVLTSSVPSATLFFSFKSSSSFSLAIFRSQISSVSSSTLLSSSWKSSARI